MKKKFKFAVLIFLTLFLPFFAVGSASATLDSFDMLLVNNDTPSGGGSGFEGGTWYEYPQAIEPTWWNQWFYDDPWALGGKEVRLGFDIEPIDTSASGWVDITINWSTTEWSLEDPVGDSALAPPVPGWVSSPENYLERINPPLALSYFPEFWDITEEGLPVGNFEQTGPDGLYHLETDWFWLPIDFNPEWVSIDVRGKNVSITVGDIEHICRPVPIPITFWLLGSGLLGMIGIRSKFRK